MRNYVMIRKAVKESARGLDELKKTGTNLSTLYSSRNLNRVPHDSEKKLLSFTPRRSLATCYLKIHFNIVFLSPRSSRWPLPIDVPAVTFYEISIALPPHAPSKESY